MEESKNQVESAIARAQAALEQALRELELMPAFDPSSAGFHAHALNNYLTVAGGIVELILLHQPSQLDEQVRSWLEDVRHATDMMRRTVSHLMTASAGPEVQLQFERIDDLPIVIQRCCSYYERVAARKTIRVNTDASAAVPPVWADRVAVAAVLDNLLSNAVKYSQPGTQVWVQVRGESGGVVCKVRDEGPGLSQQDQGKLFQRGARLTPRPTAGESSTGYGLAVAKELMDRLGGKIWCESVLGQGASFTFRLPAYKESNASGPPAGTRGSG